MAALHIKDIIKAQEQQLQKESTPALVASIARLKEMAASFDSALTAAAVTAPATPAEAIEAPKDSNQVEIADITRQGLLQTDNNGVNANVVKLTETIRATQPTEEEHQENNRRLEEQTGLLRSIADALTGRGVNEGDPKKAKAPEEGDKGSLVKQFLGKLIGLFGAAFASFNPVSLITSMFKGLFKIPKAGALMIIGGLINGIIDGIEEWKKTGSITEAIISFGAGILEFLSFGLFDRKDLEALGPKLADFYIEYIEKPIGEWVEKFKIMYRDISKTVNDLYKVYIQTPVEEMAASITTVFESIQNWINKAVDQFMSVVRGIGIPAINLRETLPNWAFTGGMIPDKIGPWYPFKDAEDETQKSLSSDGGASTAAPSNPSYNFSDTAGGGRGSSVDPRRLDNPSPTITPVPVTSADALYSRSEQNAAAAAAQNNTTVAPTVISAPTTSVQQTTNNVVRKPARNSESSLQKYSAARFGFT